jgi:hypothetical protein
MALRQVASEMSKLRQKKLAKERQTCLRQKRNINNNNERRSDELRYLDNGIMCHELGRMDQVCIHCGAKFWMEERNSSSSRASPTLSICCVHSKVLLPRLIEPPSKDVSRNCNIKTQCCM